MSKHDKNRNSVAYTEEQAPTPERVKLNYGEWLTLRKHSTFQPAMLTQKGAPTLQALVAKGLVEPRQLKITPLGERALSEYFP